MGTPTSAELALQAEVRLLRERIAELEKERQAGVVDRDITERKQAVEQVSRSQRTFFELVERAPFGIYVVDSQFHVAHMNAASQAGTFRNVRPVIGRDFDEVMRILWPEPVAAEIVAVFRHTLETGEVYYSPRFVNPRHDMETVESYGWELHRMTLPDGQYGVICYYFDSTKLRDAEAALRESEEKYRELFESIDQGFCTIEVLFDENEKPVDYRFVMVNPAFERQTGIPNAAGRRMREIAPLHEEHWFQLYGRIALTGEPMRFENPATQLHRYYDVFAWRIGVPAQRRVAILFNDISDRRRAEAALRESEEQFRTLANAIPQLCWMANADGWIFWYNQRWYEYTGTTPEQMEGWGWQTVHDPEALPKVLDRWKGSITTGEPFDMVFPLRGADGVCRPFLTRVMPVRDRGGNVVRWFGTNTDISEQRNTEEALRRSEARWNAAIENFGEGAIIATEAEQVIYWNPAARAMYGFASDQEGIGPLQETPDTFELWSPDGRRLLPLDEWPMRRIKRGETVHHLELQLRRPDQGWEKIVSYSCAMVETASGERLIFLSVYDLTEQRKAEHALAASERLYRAIGESIDFGVWVCAPDGRNTYVSESFLKLVGITQEQCSNFGWGSVLHPDDAERTITAWKECVLSEGRWQIEHRFRGADGQWHPVLAVGVPVHDEQGQISCWAGINLDISALKRAEEEVRRSNAVLEGFFEASPGILNIINDNFRYLKTDRLTPSYFGLTRESIIGHCVAELAPDFMREFGPMMREVIETGQPRLNMEVRSPVPGRSGEMAHWLASYFPVPLPEGKRAIGVVGVEITEIKKAEERLRQAQKLESLGLLAGGVAHDFNNLLVGVIGNASLAQEMLPPDHPAADIVQAVIKCGEQAAHLTRQMLAYSGKGKFLMEPLNLSAIIPEMIGLVRPSISKKIALHLDLNKRLPTIEADRGQVQQVFMNLALNAAEAIGSHDGVVTLRAGVQVVDDTFMRLNREVEGLGPGEYVYLEVHDTGCGMDESTKTKIFDPFFSTKFTGRGLGLAAVAGIVRGHKGTIIVRSTLGKGSCFTVLFPVAARPAEQLPVTVLRAALQGSGVILVVDDEAVVREMAKKALERHGYTVLLADSGMAAIDVFRRHPTEIAVVLLDLSMPHMSGEETLPELRKIRPEAKVIISSGYSEAETMALFGGQKVSGFVQKPYTSIGLAEKVKLTLL